MDNVRFYDQTLSMIQQGQIATALPMLTGKLYNAYVADIRWREERDAIRSHPLYTLLQSNPYVSRANVKPRGYAGDAVLIDYIYNKCPGQELGSVERTMFDCTIAFQTAEGVRLRRDYAEQFIGEAYAADKKVAALACGHFREGDSLVGQNMSNFTLVDQDPLSLDIASENHPSAQIICANVIHYLRNCVSKGVKFDLIYTLGLTDYLDARAMRLLHKLMKNCLAPGGDIILANFMPDHLAIGWMDAVMDWHLIYRNEDELASYAYEVGLIPTTWVDPTGSIVWCRMRQGNAPE
jgi:extracellular factor (EF) 3-hydroxypalmitic acid methyl ester biosynthesis protein